MSLKGTSRYSKHWNQIYKSRETYIDDVIQIKPSFCLALLRDEGEKLLGILLAVHSNGFVAALLGHDSQDGPRAYGVYNNDRALALGGFNLGVVAWAVAE